MVPSGVTVPVASLRLFPHDCGSLFIYKSCLLKIVPKLQVFCVNICPFDKICPFAKLNKVHTEKQCLVGL